MRMKDLSLKQNGITSLMMTLVICIVSTIFLFNSIEQISRNRILHVREADTLILNEMTMSAFTVMEAALARRLWEPPPDAHCLKERSFSVHGSFPNGATWKVDASYNAKTKNYEMVAFGQVNGLKAKYLKYLKVMDASEFLLFSASDRDVQMYRLYNPATPTSLIANDRRIYTKGRVVFSATVDMANPKINFAGSGAPFPTTYGTILQGDRMQFVGGIQYNPQIVPEPLAPLIETPLFQSILSPYSNSWGSAPKTWGQQGGGVAVLTRSLDVATRLTQEFITPGGITRAEVARSVYPIALFGGTPPLKAWSGSDSGAYFNDPARSSVFYYSYGDANNFGVRGDYTCFSKADALVNPAGKFCSYSEHFPKGFEKWRKDANLEGVLFTKDAEEIPSPRLNWDNLQALEEDARQCGFVLGAHTGAAQKDCQFWEKNFMTKYRAHGGADVCEQVSPLDLDSIAFPNFNPADLVDGNPNQDLLLRRVVYLKVPTVVSQANAKGLMTTVLGDSAKRKNLSVWIVSEDLLTLQGYQAPADLTSPLDVDPWRIRQIHFNFDTLNPPGSKIRPIPLVLLSPEHVHLISPQYVPMDFAKMTAAFPVSGGQIRPVRHIRTDYPRQENDGFKYGFRHYNLHDIALITSSNIDPGNPFFLRGLWSSPDSSADKYIINLCMVSKAGSPQVGEVGFNINEKSKLDLSLSASLNSPIPLAGSRFYKPPAPPGFALEFPLFHTPQVFWHQIANGHPSRQESEVTLTGLRIFSDFEAMHPAGARDLSTPKYQPINGPWNFTFDISNKRFEFQPTFYYQPQAAGRACIEANARWLAPIGAALTDPSAVHPKMNEGRYIFSHQNPANTYRNLGGLVGVDMPVIEAGQ